MGRRWSLALVLTILAIPAAAKGQSASEARLASRVGELSGIMEPERDARTALLRGLAVPGLGQFYAGKPAIGAGYLGATTTAVLIGLLSERIRIECLSPLENGGCPDGMEYSREERRHLLGRSLAAAGAIAVAGAVHAWFDVRRSQGRAGDVKMEGEAAVGVGLVNAEWAGDRVRLGLVHVRF